MGIHCDINLLKRSDEVYQPGQTVAGLIKYVLDEPTEFKSIIVSLKGKGVLTLEVRYHNTTAVYYGKEDYVDMDYVVQSENALTPVGSHDIKFAFKLPECLPSSVKLSKSASTGHVRCKIKYYIRIKFEKEGVFARNKHFRQKITVVSGATPRLLREPVIHGATKKLVQMFSSKPSLINIKATILNSVVPVGGKVEVHYEVENDSNITVKNVEIKLVEMYKFKAKGHSKVSRKVKVPECDIKTTSINSGETQTMPIEFIIPPDRHTLDNSKIISRDYAVKMEAALPLPYKNVVLYIPFQIELNKDSTEESLLEEKDTEIAHDDPPPSYWVAMGETEKDDDDDDSDTEFEKGDDEKKKK